ncbi:MAG: glycosyltransferase family 4 protein [Anaerolineales bacterium]|nr:glycosyltransferase family 4 protein [Anaerolineales bacterium]MCA9928691.1 glycosyltransferase family 4 protein [Anaerolineales bacterium]
MKVLMIAPQPFFEPRGTPISVYQRLHGLSDLGYEVDLVTYHVGEDVEIPGVTIHRSPIVPFIKKVKIGPSIAKLPLDIMLFFMSLWMLLKNRYDVIHSHEEAAFFAVFLSKLFRVPHLYDMHSSLPKQLANFNFGNHLPIVKLFEFLENMVLKSCDVVLTIGTDLEDYVLFVNRQANHIRIENIAVHNDAHHERDSVVKLKQSLNLNGKLPIVYTGTFEGYQGLDVLFESARTVVDKQANAQFVMVGGKPEQVAYWQNEVNKLGISENVTFTGIVPLDESLLFLELADILVSPRTEGLSVPLKIYSYLHSGKPTVATNIFAHTQILDEETAVIVEPNAQDYAAGLMRLIENPEWGSQIGENARLLAEKEFSKEGYLSKLERAYLAIKYQMRISDISASEQIGTTVPVRS